MQVLREGLKREKKNSQERKPTIYVNAIFFSFFSAEICGKGGSQGHSNDSTFKMYLGSNGWS